MDRRTSTTVTMDLNLGFGLQHPNQLQVRALEAWMLWPDDETQRDEFIKAAWVEFYRDLSRDDQLSVTTINELVDIAADCRPMRDFLKAREERILEGCITGAVVYHAVSNSGGIKKTVEAIAGEIEAHRRLLPQTIHNKVLPALRPVAHFWAAYVDAWINDEKKFPCSVRNFLEFLAIAEQFRLKAESARLPKMSKTVLRPGEAYKLPNVALPKVDLQFSPNPRQPLPRI